MFDVRRLSVLEAVVRTGSLGAAAAALNYTTSAISQQITALERDIGVPLVVRGRSGTSPTPAGRKLLEHAERILGAVAAAEHDLARLGTADPAVLRVASFASAAAAILPQAVVRFRAARPRVDLRLIAADPDEAVALLGAGGAEAAVVTEVPGEVTEYPGVVTVPIYDDEFYVVLPARHRLAAATEISLSALAAEQWVVSSATGTCPDTRVFRTACARAGFTPSVTFRSDDYGTVQGMVAAGVGVSLVPSLAAIQVCAGVVVRRLADRGRPVRRIAIATATEPLPGSALAALVTIVRELGGRPVARRASTIPTDPSAIAAHAAF